MISPDGGHPIYCGGDRCGRRKSSTSRPVVKLDSSGNVIAEYCSGYLAAEQLDLPKMHVSEICRGKRPLPASCDYQLKYKGDIIAEAANAGKAALKRRSFGAHTQQ